MKGKRFFFVLMMAVVLAAGWIFTLKTASGINEINEQEQLVQQAEAYLKKKIYVRGIPLLEQALDIETENNPEIQRKLLEAYWSYGDVDAYYRLLSAMDNENSNAEAEDYVALAEYYQKNGFTENALQIVVEGQAKHKDSELDVLYEKMRYECRMYETSYQDLKQTGNIRLYACFDGTAWNYADDNGKEYLTVNAQEAYGFNQDGFGVIKVNGRYCTILSSGDLYGIDETGVDEVKGLDEDCIVAKKDGLYGYYNYDFENISGSLQYEDMTLMNDGAAAVKKNGKWGIINAERKMVTDYIYDSVAVNSLGCAFAGGRAMVRQNGAWKLINAAGKDLSDQTFADARAPESDECIAVANSDGLWGFVDPEGNMAIDYQYYDAHSFSDEMAAVMPVNNWGYISSKNNLVIDADFNEATPFHDGKAIVKLKDGAALVEQLYYSEEDK